MVFLAPVSYAVQPVLSALTSSASSLSGVLALFFAGAAVAAAIGITLLLAFNAWPFLLLTEGIVLDGNMSANFKSLD